MPLVSFSSFAPFLFQRNFVLSSQAFFFSKNVKTVLVSKNMQTVFIFFLFLSFNPFSKWRLFSISEKALEKREREEFFFALWLCNLVRAKKRTKMLMIKIAFWPFFLANLFLWECSVSEFKDSFARGEVQPPFPTFLLSSRVRKNSKRIDLLKSSFRFIVNDLLRGVPTTFLSK